MTFEDPSAGNLDINLEGSVVPAKGERVPVNVGDELPDELPDDLDRLPEDFDKRVPEEGDELLPERLRERIPGASCSEALSCAAAVDAKIRDRAE